MSALGMIINEKELNKLMEFIQENDNENYGHYIDYVDRIRIVDTELYKRFQGFLLNKNPLNMLSLGFFLEEEGCYEYDLPDSADEYIANLLNKKMYGEKEIFGGYDGYSSDHLCIIIESYLPNEIPAELSNMSKKELLQLFDMVCNMISDSKCEVEEIEIWDF
ncbi:hypothetical protein [Enterocloster citroniae]